MSVRNVGILVSNAFFQNVGELLPRTVGSSETLVNLISVRGWVDLRAIVRLEGLGELKNPMTSSGLEPVTLRLVA
jgi:hypothetical protein